MRRRFQWCLILGLVCSGCSSRTGSVSLMEESISMTPMASVDTTIQEESEDWQNENPVMIDLNEPGNAAGVEVSENQIRITQGGTYALSGTWDGQIRIAADEQETVRLVLNQAVLSHEDDALIYVESAEKVILTLAEGTQNKLQDGSLYKDQTEATATIYSEFDLTVNGSGSLIITARANNAIQSKKELILLNGTVVMDAKDKGLVGKDAVKIKGGSWTITSGKDAIQATNSEDPAQGYIVIAGGELTIDSKQDGIQAESQCVIEGGTIEITAAQAEQDTASHEEELSIKGIKAGADLFISGGIITIDSSDDALHSNANVTIAGGELLLASGDDAIHANQTLSVYDGIIEIEESYEGLEGSKVLIEGGEIDLTAQDDGINAAGGQDSSQNVNPTGFTQDSFSDGTHQIVISGGFVTVDAMGDGLDSNGSIEISGGTTIIYGPQDNRNGSLDFAARCEITGGVLVAIGSSGMLQVPSDSSTQYTISTTQASGNANNSVMIKDASGTVLWSGFAQKPFEAVLYSSPELVQNESYSIWVNDTEIERITIEGVVSGSGNIAKNGPGRMDWGGAKERPQNVPLDPDGEFNEDMPPKEDPRQSRQGQGDF